MDIYTVIILITVFILVVTAADVITNRLISPQDKRNILIVCITIFIAGVCEYIGEKTNGAPEDFIELHKTAKLIEFCVSPCIAVAAANAYGKMFNKNIAIGILAAHTIFEIIAFYNEWVFRIDAENVYHREELYSVYIAAFVISIIFCYICLILKNKKYQSKHGITSILILLFLSYGIGVQMVYSGIPVDFMCVAVGGFFMYHYRGNVINQVDVTTRLLNRRCFERQLENMKSPAYVLIFDINKFKIINDTYGHNEGDKCLKSIADIILSTYGKYGFCYRIGGDEFCVIMYKNTDRVQTLNKQFETEVEKVRISGKKIYGVSLGAAYYDEKETTAAVAVKKADEMMYKMK